MIGCSERPSAWVLGLGLVGASLLGGRALAQGAEIPQVPVPEVPEAPEVPEPSVPDLPDAPQLPSLGKDDGSRVPEGYTGPTRLVLDHRKRFVAYPRFGYLQVLARGDGEGVHHADAGVDLQLALNRRILLAAEFQGLYLLSGDYGLVYADSLGTLQTYGAGETTFLTGAGVGLFTSLLDGQELWTHLTVKAGYLHPFYLGAWLTADVEKEFLRTEDRYWVVSLAPQLGALVPFREDGSYLSGARIMAGVDISLALIFGGRR